ncbi:hypothetical protein [Lysobacter niastensis]|uniref:Uncharacterized protein n=1 Tax=Lysobacter niastensis TaxID=380629 RepID=A0ABS0B7X9_9GAMM|nr:hypothetical protein [Lysobacter niastensis]MBF6023220.1 hypothetical protein [Lysobacter niastensis]
MNIFTNLLFLQGHLADPHMFDEDDERYSRGYGNRAASEQFFAPLGHARSADERDEARSDASPALGGCA